MKYVNGEWSAPININVINTTQWESQPCISHDGKELFFVRRDKRLGTTDIFVSTRNEDGSWSVPKRLHSTINTEGNEMSPFIHHDGKTLYFSSDTHLGMGGYDIFVSYRDENSFWSAPLNLGYPLNTEGDEINLITSQDAEMAFISSNNKNTYGGFDIYEFELDDAYKPQNIEQFFIDEEEYAEALQDNKSIILNDIHFEFDSAQLEDSSEIGIMSIVIFLMDFPNLSIVLVGHTDDMGDPEYNLRLSEMRAQSVKDALINKGISGDRIKTRGLGATKPLVDNDTDAHRALNRRVEMSIE